MKRVLLCMALVLSTTIPSCAAAPSAAARKLFPLITEGIRNAKGEPAMDCKIAADGLTVTDAAWDSFPPPPGHGKRWCFNATPYSEQPLKGYRFDSRFSGLQVTINEEIFDLAKPWVVSESHQEILQLGGRQQIGLPEWFHTPQGRLSPDFAEGSWFPKGWSLPRGKFACWEGAGRYDQTDLNGRAPALSYGFTQVAENTLSVGGSVAPMGSQCRVFGDAEWLDMKDGANPNTWHNDAWKDRGRKMRIVIADFENAGAPNWDAAQYDKFRSLAADFRKERPDCLLGCWGVGVAKAIPVRQFCAVDDQGRPDGVISLRGAAYWKAKYDNPRAELNPIFECGLSIGNPSVYWLNGGNQAHLYAVVQEWEVGKLARPDAPNVISTWIQTEFVDDYPLSTYQFKRPDGSEQTRWIKHQAPPSFVYALSLFAHTRMDGAYCWEVGNIYSEDPADAGELGEGGMQAPVRKTVRGTTKDVWYYIKYFGFYNYHVLGMWQAARNKDIIEAKTEWFMPEIMTSTGGVWRTGDERYPSYCSFYKEPLVRAKYGKGERELLVVACNPYNTGVQTVKVRDPRTKAQVSLQLVGDYPAIKRFRMPSGK